MRNTALAIGFLALLITPTAAQKTEIEAANGKWMEFFSKGDFDGAASLYTVDATAFPPGSDMVKGRVAIAAMWKGMADHVSDRNSRPSMSNDWDLLRHVRSARSA